MPFFRHPESILASYPGYPLVIDTIAWVPGIGLKRAGFAVTIAAGLAVAWGLTRLGMALIGDRRLSLIMVAVWAVAPASIVLSMVYSEALFCALAIWCLLALVERRWPIRLSGCTSSPDLSGSRRTATTASTGDRASSSP